MTHASEEHVKFALLQLGDSPSLHVLVVGTQRFTTVGVVLSLPAFRVGRHDTMLVVGM